MGVAKFMAKDPYAPGATREELDDLFEKMEGILDWAINENGEVAVEYDHDLINDQMIEGALSGVGLALKHISDAPNLPDEKAQQELDREQMHRQPMVSRND